MLVSLILSLISPADSEERFQLRRTSFKLLTSSPSSLLSKPRASSTFRPLALRPTTRSTPIAFQRSWISSEAEAKRSDEGETPITAEEPTPEEQVEDQIHSDNAAAKSGYDTTTEGAAPPSAEEPAEASGGGLKFNTTPSVSVSDGESTSKINAAADAVKEKVSNTVGSIAETARQVTGIGSDVRSTFPKNHLSPMVVEPKSTLYVANLFFDVTENDLSNELSRFGTITQCRIIRDSRGLSKGFGYVDFETIAAATKAIETLHQQLFEGRRLVVQYAAYSSRQLDNERTGFKRSDAPRKPLNPPSKTLFIGNMSFEMTDRDLHALFRGIRNVIDVRIAIDRRTGQSRGFAHADFIDVKSATDALALLATKEMYGRKLRLDYSYGQANNAPRNQPDADTEKGRRLEESAEHRSHERGHGEF